MEAPDFNSSEAVKHDNGKNRLELLAPEFVEGVGSVLTFGADKYTPGNWAKGMKWSRPFGAALRHLWAWARGEKSDQETGLSHLYHAGCCIMFLAAYEARNVGTDDRKEIGLIR
jgi:hypothetical protein